MNTYTPQTLNQTLLNQLDKGINDMEADNEVTVEDASRIVTDMVNQYKLKRI